MSDSVAGTDTLAQWKHVSWRRPAQVDGPRSWRGPLCRKSGGIAETSTGSQGRRFGPGSYGSQHFHGLVGSYGRLVGLGIIGSIVSQERLDQQLHFLLEIDRLKQVERQTAITGGSRRENTAEHSWHLAMYALILQEWSNVDVDIAHVLALCLVHDIVEIDAGDTFAYDTAGYADKEDREKAAAERLFGLLPEDQAQKLRSLWEEYEAQETPESQFANAVDRMQPAMLNHHADDTSPWKRHGITVPQAMKRLSPIGDGSAALWDRTQSIISEAARRGNLIEES